MSHSTAPSHPPHCSCHHLPHPYSYNALLRPLPRPHSTVPMPSDFFDITPPTQCGLHNPSSKVPPYSPSYCLGPNAPTPTATATHCLHLPSGCLRYDCSFTTSPPQPPVLINAASGGNYASCASHFCPGESELQDHRFTVYSHRTMRPHPLYYETTPINRDTRLLCPENEFLGQTVIRHAQLTPSLPTGRKPSASKFPTTLISWMPSAAFTSFQKTQTSQHTNQGGGVGVKSGAVGSGDGPILSFFICQPPQHRQGMDNPSQKEWVSSCVTLCYTAGLVLGTEGKAPFSTGEEARHHHQGPIREAKAAGHKRASISSYLQEVCLPLEGSNWF